MEAKHSLAVRVLRVVLLPIMVGALVLLLVSFFMMRRAFERSYQSRAESIVKTLDSAIGSTSDLQNKEILTQQILKLIYANPDIELIQINLPGKGEKLQTFVSNEAGREGQVVEDYNQQAWKEHKLVSTNLGVGTQARYIMALPIEVSGKVVGTYEIGLSYKESYRAFILQVLYFVGGTVLTLLVVSLAISYLTRRIVITPIRQLVLGAQKIGEGELTYQVELKTGDELGVLAQAMNLASQKLHESYLGLEQKITERTSELKEKLNLIEQQKNNLEKSKSAMINLLEDEKELEKELSQEKESVEIKVKERTRELQTERARFLASIEGIVRAYILLDTRGKVILTNRRLGEILGEEKGEWSISLIQEKLGGEVDLHAAIQGCLKRGDLFERKEMSYGAKFLDLYVTPIYLDQVDKRDPMGVLMLIGDITEAKILQRSRDEFFSIASHELRTPLTAIRGNAEMILDNYQAKIQDQEVKEMLGDIHEGSVRLIEIVNDFLNVSRLEMGKMEFKLEPIKMGELVESVIKEFQVTGSRQKLSLEQAPLKAGIGMALGDRDRLKQVLINLIGNAFKFTQEGGIKLEVEQQAKEVVVWVSDTGEGIAKALQGLLFHKFQQAGSSLYTRDTSKGTGLGLYISKLMMEGMGGKIWLEKSEAGKGSTFAISLPISKSEEKGV